MTNWSSPPCPAHPAALPGVWIDRLFTLRTVEDTLKIQEFIEQHHPRSAVLAGGGFIGVELMENLRELGIDVTVVQRPRQLLNPLDADMAAFLHAKLRQKGVRRIWAALWRALPPTVTGSMCC